MKNRLTGLPGASRGEELSAGEREHLASCPGCRDLALHEQSLRMRIADAGRVVAPGDSYWSSILPKVKARTTRRLPSDRFTEWFGSARFVIQGAGLAVILILALTINITGPPVPEPTLTMAYLSETELLDLSISVRYTGLLDHASDSDGIKSSTIVDLIEELIAGTDDAELYASIDPIVVLGEVNDSGFGEIVDLLNSKK